MTNIPTAGIKYSDKKADILKGNTLALENPSVSVKDVKANTLLSGHKFTGLEAKTIRKVDLLRLQIGRDYASKAEGSKQIVDSLTVISEYFSNISSEAGSRPTLAKEVGEFISASLNAQNDPSNQSLKRIVVDAAHRAANAINDATKLCIKQKYNAQVQIAEELQNLNSALIELAQINTSLNACADTDDVSHLLDQRDALVSQISSFVAVDPPFYTHKQGAMLTTSGFVLVNSENNFAQFSTSINTVTDIENKAKLNDIYYIYDNLDPLDKTEKVSSKCNDIFRPNGDLEAAYGKVPGLIDLYENKIDSILNYIDTLAANFSEKANALHNSGSNYSGRTEIVGTKTFANTDGLSWTGSAKLGLVDSDGMAVKTSTSAGGFVIPPLKLNLQKLSEISDGQKLTTSNIVKEINAHFNNSMTSSIGIGVQSDNTNKHLIKNIAMAVCGHKNNQIRFDFDVFNNSDFKSDFEVLGITYPTGSTINGSLPDKAEIQPGERTRTFQTISLSKGTVTGSQNIDIKFRAKGENGIFGEGTLRFTVDFDQTIEAGTRIYGSLIGGASDGDFVSVSMDQVSYVSAAIVDENGTEVTGGSKGFLSIKDVSGKNYGIVVQDDDSKAISYLDGFGSVKRGFGHLYGLNNLFNVDETDGKYCSSIKIRNDIFADENLLSSSRLQSVKTIQEERLTGSAKATTSIDFEAFGGLINLVSYDGSTITVGPQTYTLVNGAASSAYEISISGLTSAQEIVDKVVTTLNSDQYFENILTFSSGTNSLVITANDGGISGNNVAYRLVSTGASIFNTSADTTSLNLSGGTETSQFVSISLHHM
ncbi:MAG: hypothetical protein SFT91_01600, partial [Rickettsiaceae bacterium]|nr:hypothetical protein [Rickettsiaceae bacterium]